MSFTGRRTATKEGRIRIVLYIGLFNPPGQYGGYRIPVTDHDRWNICRADHVQWITGKFALVSPVIQPDSPILDLHQFLCAVLVRSVVANRFRLFRQAIGTFDRLSDGFSRCIFPATSSTVRGVLRVPSSLAKKSRKL